MDEDVKNLAENILKGVQERDKSQNTSTTEKIEIANTIIKIVDSKLHKESTKHFSKKHLIPGSSEAG